MEYVNNTYIYMYICIYGVGFRVSSGPASSIGISAMSYMMP